MDYYKLLLELGIMAMLVKGINTYGWKMYWPAFLCVIVPFAISLLTSLVQGNDGQLFFLASLLTLALQYVAALIVFNFLIVYEDTIVVWTVWFLCGGVAIFVFVPTVIRFIGV